MENDNWLEHGSCGNRVRLTASKSDVEISRTINDEPLTLWNKMEMRTRSLWHHDVTSEKQGSPGRRVFVMCVNRLYCFCISTVGCRNGANLFSRTRARRAGRVNDPTIERDEASVGGGAKPADPRLVSAKRSTTHSSATSWEPPLKSRHWNAASQSRRASTHALLYYRKAKNKNTILNEQQI
jgi:hypothetical protein